MAVIAEFQPNGNRGSRKAAEGPIDMVHLAKQALGDPGLEIEILRMFDEIVAVHFARLERCGVVTDVLHHLHTLRAASEGVGAWSLATLARTMEDEIKAGRPVNPERVDDIEIACAEVHGFIAAQVAAADATFN